jgi:damage-control phosphatase, subfamily I
LRLSVGALRPTTFMSYRIFPECRACLERLVDLTVGLATPDPDLKERARRRSLTIIDQEFRPEAISAVIANRFHRAIRELTGNEDPFLPRKQTETVQLAAIFQSIAPSYADDLNSLLRLAVVGNAIDFFRDDADVRRDMQAPAFFWVSHLARFQELLQGPPGLLLYLADNAGEQFFDAPLVAHLRRLGWQVLYVVKGGPIQNDLTRTDLAASGLEDELSPVADTGARTVGLELSQASPDFLELYRTARIIVAKGMGHFETLSRFPDPRLFFLLQAKCGPVAQALGAPLGSFIFRQPDNTVFGFRLSVFC